MIAAPDLFETRLARRRLTGKVFVGSCIALSLIGVAVLSVLIGRILWQGWDWVTPSFLSNFPSVWNPELSGVKSALWGTIWLIVMTALISIPTGIAAAVHLEEFAARNRLSAFIQLNINNLAGVPSIVYGILGLAVFVRWLNFGRSLLAGALTMSLLILPVIIIASREALRAVPQSIRHAAYALGATRWQTVRAHVLPAALPGIMTGVILGLSRAIGEAAPLIMIGAVTYIAFVPQSPMDPFVALPIQIYAWCDQPQPEFQHLAAAGIIVLLGVLLPMNALAVAVRAWHQRRKVW